MTNSSNEKIASDASNANAVQSDKANEVTKELQKDAQAYNTEMSNTAYQRGIADMQKAGLNPVLAGMNQTGASSPTSPGGSGQGGKSEVLRNENVLGAGVSSAIAMKSLMADVGMKDSNIALNRALGVKAVADTNVAGASAKQIQTKNKALESELQAIKSEAEARRRKADYDTEFSTFDAWTNRINQGANAAGALIDLGKKSFVPKKMEWFKKPTKFDPNRMFYGSKETGEIYNP